MKVVLEEILGSGNMSASSLSSIGIPVNQIFMGSVQANWSGGGSPVGVVKIQGSNDDVDVKPAAPVANNGVGEFVGADPGGNVVNWADISGATLNVSGNSGSGMIPLATITYKWLRAVYTKGSGQGSLNLVFFGKG